MRECPTPFKVFYESPREARQEASRIDSGRKKRKKVAYTPSHAYKCECGGYHLTTQRKSRQRAVRAAQLLYEREPYDVWWPA